MIDRATRMEQLAVELEEAILVGRLPKGSALPSERLLAEHYQLSRTTIRAAVQRLVAKRLVAQAGGHATVVDERPWTFDRLVERISAARGRPEAPRLLEELLGVRRLLLVQAAALACDRGDDTAMLSLLVGELRQSVLRRSPPRLIAGVERELVGALVDASGSPALAMFLASFDRLHEYVPGLVGAASGRPSTPVEEWQAVVWAIEARARREAGEAVRRLLVGADALLLEAFARLAPPLAAAPGADAA